MSGPEDEDGAEIEPEQPDEYRDEAEDAETLDDERADHEGWPRVDERDN